MLVGGKPKLLFISTRFLFPVDSGGKIRTTQILRGLLGGAFHITLASPAPTNARELFGQELATVCDRFVDWPERQSTAWLTVQRFLLLSSRLPVPVAIDRSRQGRTKIARLIREGPQVVVFDFPHAAVLAPAHITIPSVLFTHNVEAEIFERHAKVEKSKLRKILWQSQHRKMVAFEKQTLNRFDLVIAVAERDAEVFRAKFDVENTSVISTGVDLDFFSFQNPPSTERCVFIGSMDWLANIDAMNYFMDDIWPLVQRQRPDAQMLVVGRTPPSSLVQKAKESGLNWQFTGYVDDVRPYVHSASVSVIPLRVGGGTRLKVYEAMALGCPVVSTQTGVEGLPVEHDRHYLCANNPVDFAAKIIELFDSPSRRLGQARAARALVEENFSFRRVAQQFGEYCLSASTRRSGVK